MNVVGRFQTRDPAGYVDGFNLYAYVGNNPLGNWDPTGLTGDDYFEYREQAREARAAAAQAAQAAEVEAERQRIRAVIGAIEMQAGHLQQSLNNLTDPCEQHRAIKRFQAYAAFQLGDLHQAAHMEAVADELEAYMHREIVLTVAGAGVTKLVFVGGKAGLQLVARTTVGSAAQQAAARTAQRVVLGAKLPVSEIDDAAAAGIRQNVMSGSRTALVRSAGQAAGGNVTSNAVRMTGLGIDSPIGTLGPWPPNNGFLTGRSRQSCNREW